MNRLYTAALCSPTRAGIMIGRYPDRVGLRTVIPPWSEFGVDTTEVFLPQMLANAGYSNRGLIGKWHLGHALAAYHPLKKGFTHFYGHLNGNIDYFDHTREGELDWHNDWKPCYDKGYSTDLLATETIRCINEYSRENTPFFIYLAFNAPHGPLQAKEEDLLQYGYDPIKPLFSSNKGFGAMGMGNTKRQTYAAMVSNMDKNIGRVLQALKGLNLENNTLVVFMSDNGAAPGEGGSSGDLRGHKGTEWEGGVRAPAIIKWPAGFKGGWVCNQVMGYIDLVPTFLNIAAANAKPRNAFDGISMLPVLTGKAKFIDRDMYLGSGAIVTSEWKLIEASKAGANMKIKSDQLYNISAEPFERSVVNDHTNVYSDLKGKIQKYDAIESMFKAPDYGKGRQDFVAPKEWTIQ